LDPANLSRVAADMSRTISYHRALREPLPYVALALGPHLAMDNYGQQRDACRSDDGSLGPGQENLEDMRYLALLSVPRAGDWRAWGTVLVTVYCARPDRLRAQAD
jgi:hypothetical protein